MSSSNIRHNDPLFVVIFRDAQANALLRKWITENKIQNAQVQDHRMQLYDHHSLSTFMVTWSGNWENLVIWDAWNKRHLDLQNT